MGMGPHTTRSEAKNDGRTAREVIIDDALDRANNTTDPEVRSNWLQQAAELSDSPSYRNRNR
jgi:hypothetical protein